MLLLCLMISKINLAVLGFCLIVKRLLLDALRRAVFLLKKILLQNSLTYVIYRIIIEYTDFLTLAVSENGARVTVLILIFLISNNLILRFMNNSFFLFIFSNIPLSIAVALPFVPFNDDPTNYTVIWDVIEENFFTTRYHLTQYSLISEEKFDCNIIKMDFRAK